VVTSVTTEDTLGTTDGSSELVGDEDRLGKPEASLLRDQVTTALAPNDAEADHDNEDDVPGVSELLAVQAFDGDITAEETTVAEADTDDDDDGLNCVEGALRDNEGDSD
jgi:hypothetical protein